MTAYNPVKKRSAWYSQKYDPLHIFIREAIREHEAIRETVQEYKIRLLHHMDAPDQRKHMEDFVRSFECTHMPYSIHTGKRACGILYTARIPGTNKARYIVKPKLFNEEEACN